MSTDGSSHRSLVHSLGLYRLGLYSLTTPYFTAVVVAVVTGLAVLGVLKLKVDDSLSELFRTNTKEFNEYEEIDRRFPSSEYDVLVVVEGRDLLKQKQLEAFRDTVIDLQLTDGVKGLVSMLSARGMPDATGYAPPVVPDDLPEDPAAYDAVIQALATNDIVKGKFLSEDGSLALIVMWRRNRRARSSPASMRW
jgi:predicted RND superfamily exporter protein